MNRRLEGGFTLIELVVIITILGILAAFAVPRFASLEGQARLAATQAMAGSIRSGASLAHALWLAQGDPNSTSVTMEGTAIAIENGYPTDASIASTLVETTGFVISNPTANTTRFSKASSQNPPTAITDCFVDYTEAPVDGAPTVAATTGGC